MSRGLENYGEDLQSLSEVGGRPQDEASRARQQVGQKSPEHEQRKGGKYPPGDSVLAMIAEVVGLGAFGFIFNPGGRPYLSHSTPYEIL